MESARTEKRRVFRAAGKPKHAAASRTETKSIPEVRTKKNTMMHGKKLMAGSWSQPHKGKRASRWNEPSLEGQKRKNQVYWGAAARRWIGEYIKSSG